MRKTLMVLWLLLLGCTADRYTVSRLYFGLSGPDDMSISKDEFTGFIDSAVSPLFPDGMTIYEAEGRWRDSSDRNIREGSIIVEIVHPRSRETMAKIEDVINLYKNEFKQESVLLLQSRIRARF